MVSKKNSNPAVILLQDLNEIKGSTNFYISELDSKVNKLFILITEGKIKNIKDAIDDLRLELWLEYTAVNLEAVEKEIKDLSRKLASVSIYRTRINELKRKFEEIDSENFDFNVKNKEKYFITLSDIFEKITIISNEIEDNKDDLIKDAWIKFLSVLFLPAGAIVTAAMVYLMPLYFPRMEFKVIVAFWTLSMFILFWILLTIARNPFKMDSEENDTGENKENKVGEEKSE